MERAGASGATEDRQAVRRVLAGETEAFEVLVRRWQRPLLNLAYRFCRDRGRAEEMVQEAFLRVFRKLDRFDERSSFSSWLFTVATRLFVSEMRRYQPAWLTVEEPDRLPSASDPGSAAVGAQREELVRRAVGALPDKYRSAIVVYYFQEKNLDEAARILGVAPGTLKSRLHRARGLLERRLADRLGPALLARET